MPEQRLALELISSQAPDAAEPFRLLAESIPQLVWTARPDGRFDWTNQRFVQYTGLNHEASRGWAWQQAVHEDDLSTCLSAWTTAIDQAKPLNIEVRLQDKAGNYRWFLARAEPILNREQMPACWFGTFTDVQDEKQKQLAVEHSFRTSIDNLLDCFGIYSAIRHESGKIVDFRVEFVNRAACEANRMTLEEQLGQRLNQILPSHVSSGLFDAYRNVVESGEPYSAETMFYVDNYGGESQERWFDIRASRLNDGFVASWRDVTAQKLEKQSLLARQLESEERFRTLADNMTQLAWMKDASGYTFWFNRRWYEYTGTTFEEMEGWGWQKVHHPEHVDRVTSSLHECLATGQTWDLTFPIKSADGTFRWFLTRAVPIKDESGKILRWFGTNTDITDQLASERQIRERQAIFESVFATIDDGYCVGEILTDQAGQPQDYRFLEVNPRFEEMTGLKQAVGKTAYELVPELESKWVELYSRAGLDGEVLRFEERSEAMGRDFDVFVTPVEPRGRFVLVFKDITDRKRSEQQLRSRERWFRELADAAPAMLWITNSEHLCTYISRGWLEFTGQPEHQVLGQGWSEVIHPEDRDYVLNVFNHAAAEARPFEVDFRIAHSSGQYRWVSKVGHPRKNAYGSFEGYIGSVIDVDARKSAESLLRDSQKRFQVAAEAVSGIIYEYDFNTGRVERSSGLEKVLGYRIDEVAPTAKWWAEQMHPEDLDCAAEQFENLIPSVGKISNEYRVRHRDGHWIHVWDQAMVIADEAGNASKMIGCTVDITQQKAFAQSLVQAREAAENANKSRGEFLANMSHEIRTPMTAILGYADILGEHLSDPDNLQLVDTIRKNGKFLLEIINDILDLSKIDAGMLEMNDERIRLESLLEDLRSLIQIRAQEKNLALRVNFDGLIPEVIETDALRLRQILLNLLGNAIKFTKRGSVELRTRYLASAQQLQFDVIDSGMGIREDQLDKLFQPFTQADSSSTRSAGGTGLGLTISRRLARALGGDISVESEFKKGSKFTLTIHCPSQNVSLRQAQPEAEKAPESPAYISLVGTTVLVVDDRRDIRFLAQTFVEKAGGNVLLASNGQEAVEAIHRDLEQNAIIDIVLMDMQMPVMDGFQATKVLRSEGFSKPIIALTANAMKSDREDCLAAGCTDYASKPLVAAQLIQLIAKYSEDHG